MKLCIVDIMKYHPKAIISSRSSAFAFCVTLKKNKKQKTFVNSHITPWSLGHFHPLSPSPLLMPFFPITLLPMLMPLLGVGGKPEFN